MLRSLFLVTILFASTNAVAQSLSEFARNARALGMGGTYIPFVNGADAVFYNPAALGKVEGLDIKAAEVGVSLNSLSKEDIDELQNFDPNDPNTYSGLYGKRVWLQATGKTAIAVGNFAIGYLNDNEVSLELHNPTYPQFETYFRQDVGYYLGYAFNVAPGTYMGVAAKRVDRWGGIKQELSLTDVSNASSMSDIGDRFDDKGQAYGIDMAIATTVDLPLLKPTIALVWQDVGNTAFRKTAGDDAPPHITQDLSFGAGVNLDLPGLDVAFGGEVRHLMESDIETGKKLHLGAEVSLPVFDLRAGYSQGYLSYGVGVNLFILHIDAVSYTEELGAYPGQTADNRYMISLGIDLSFDADFKFTDNQGKRRKLKQRR
ncbi:hypothetical protein B9G69_017320 [Bdellovibrio sp. SKB1291214]|uniref:hypothetical protein n=1 Tax=Bdellovibrio sp. SKB1291214 TaxID=1732569 RepID=UPI000B51A1AD|nr:hypothetical protein [Bdellovibrio sp. SKB1291214]UYL08806.1 hypothetical protein B9G69_017320 [Bdellovibrio sp. SKB1291214]